MKRMHSVHWLNAIAIITASSLLSACVGALNSPSPEQFIGLGPKVQQVADDVIQARNTAYSEQKFSIDSYSFLTSHLDERGNLIGKKCKDAAGKEITVESEKALRNYRLTEIARLQEYIDEVSAYLKESAEITTAIALIDAANDLAGRAPGDYGKVASPLATAIKTAIQTVDKAVRAEALGRLATEKQAQVEKISSDIERAVRPIGEDADARINVWEMCEYQKMVLLQHENDSTLIEREARFRAFYDTKAKLRAQISGAEEAEKLFKKIPVVHKQISIDARSAKYNYKQIQELEKNIDEIKKQIESFHSAVLAAQSD